MAFDKAIATLTIGCEASNQPHEARVGIAETLFNRLRSGKYGPTIAAICLKRMWYSEWNADVADNANLERVAKMADDDPMIVDCAAAYDEAAAGSSTVGDATHFYDQSIPPPHWAAPPAKITITIGTTIFVADVP